MIVALTKGVFIDMGLVAAILPEREAGELREVGKPVKYAVMMKEPSGSDVYPEVFLDEDQCKELVSCLRQAGLLKCNIPTNDFFESGS